jgi:hypothetical protein
MNFFMWSKNYEQISFTSGISKFFGKWLWYARTGVDFK